MRRSDVDVILADDVRNMQLVRTPALLHERTGPPVVCIAEKVACRVQLHIMGKKHGADSDKLKSKG